MDQQTTTNPTADGGRRTQEFTLNGDEVVAKVKELIAEGNIRRLIIKNEDGRTMLEVPLTLGLIGAALLPVLAAIGAAAALATRCTIVVERDPTGGGEAE
jgi:Flp pilus assembly pilin Flp